MIDDDLRLMRLRDSLGDDQAAARVLSTRAAGKTILAQVYNGGSIPTTVPGLFLANPVFPELGAETEGAASATLNASTDSIAVLVIGPQAPTAGTVLQASQVGKFWTAKYGTSGGTSYIGWTGGPCWCSTIPATIYFTYSGGVSGSVLDGISDTLTYQTYPAGWADPAVSLTGKGWVGAGSFTWPAIYGVGGTFQLVLFPCHPAPGTSTEPVLFIVGYDSGWYINQAMEWYTGTCTCSPYHCGSGIDVIWGGVPYTSTSTATG